MKDLIWIEINKKNLIHNTKIIRRIIGPAVVLAPCIKANAYGHGLIDCAHTLLSGEADWLTVNSMDEAETLRRAGIKAPLLIIGYVALNELIGAVKLNIRTTIYNKQSARRLSVLAAGLKQRAVVHIKIDTGMSRQGVLPQKVDSFIHYVKKLPNLFLEGLFTHFADVNRWPFSKYSQKQLKIFQKLAGRHKNITYFHLANSVATLLYSQTHFNLVRPGLAVFGYCANKQVQSILQEKKINLKPALNLKTKVVAIKEIPTRTPVGYERTFITRRKTKIAILPIGYYDGLDRRLSNRGEVLIGGRRAKILGRICMNMAIADVSRIKNVRLEDEAVLIGKQGKEIITIEEMAKTAKTINHEVLSRLRESIPRYYI